jgi:hypothetical protein
VLVVLVLLAVVAGLLSFLVPGTLFERDAGRLAAAMIFPASYVALAIGRIPGLAIDHAGVALVGASPITCWLNHLQFAKHWSLWALHPLMQSLSARTQFR